MASKGGDKRDESRSRRKGKSGAAPSKGKGATPKGNRESSRADKTGQSDRSTGQVNHQSIGLSSAMNCDVSSEKRKTASGRSDKVVGTTPHAVGGASSSKRSGTDRDLPAKRTTSVDPSTDRPSKKVNYKRIHQLAEPKGGRPGTSSGGKVMHSEGSSGRRRKSGDRVVIRRAELGPKNLTPGSTREVQLSKFAADGLSFGDDGSDGDGMPVIHSPRKKSRTGVTALGGSRKEISAAVALANMSHSTSSPRKRRTESGGNSSATDGHGRPTSGALHRQATGRPGELRHHQPADRLLPKRPRLGDDQSSRESGYRGNQMNVRQNPLRRPATSSPSSAVNGNSRFRNEVVDQSASARAASNNQRGLRVTVQEIKGMREDQPVPRTISVRVLRLQAYMDRNPLVHKNRRKMVVADATGALVGYIKRSLPIKFSEDQCVLLSNFRANKGGTITVHDKTAITRAPNFPLSDEISVAASKLFDTPIQRMSTIADIVARGPGHPASLVARVVQSEDSRLVTDREKKQKFVKEVTLQQGSTTLKMSLWDAAAAYATFNVGDTLEVKDVSTVWSNHHRAAALTCNFPDQLAVIPAGVEEEEITIIGLEDSHNFDDLECTVESNNTICHYYVNRFQLTNRLNTNDEQNVEDLLSFLPITAVAVVQGQTITEIEVHSFAENIVYRNGRNDMSHQVIPEESVEDIFADSNNVFGEGSTINGRATHQYSDSDSYSGDSFTVEEAIHNEAESASECDSEEAMECSDDETESICSTVALQLLNSSGDSDPEGQSAPVVSDGQNVVDISPILTETPIPNEPLSEVEVATASIAIVQPTVVADVEGTEVSNRVLYVPNGSSVQIVHHSPLSTSVNDHQGDQGVGVSDSASDSVVVIDGSSVGTTVEPER